MKIEAPYPTLQTTTILPDPEFSDGEAATGEVIPKRAMNGTLRTYRKTTPRRRLTWDFRLTRPKTLELRAFIQSYFASKIRVTDHNNRVWVGNFLNNPFEARSDRAAKPDVGGVRGESNSIRIEFEGVEQ